VPTPDRALHLSCKSPRLSPDINQQTFAASAARLGKEGEQHIAPSCVLDLEEGGCDAAPDGGHPQCVPTTRRNMRAAEAQNCQNLAAPTKDERPGAVATHFHGAKSTIIVSLSVVINLSRAKMLD